jgi:WD40 repeat protein
MVNQINLPESAIHTFNFSPSGENIFIGAYNTSKLYFYNLASGMILEYPAWNSYDFITDLNLGLLIAGIKNDNFITIWNVEK